MLQPAQTTYRKHHRQRSAKRGVARSGAMLAFGFIGLKAQSGGDVSARQLEAARKAITHCVRRGGKYWIRVFPQKVLTRKSPEIPMGAGKGSPEIWVAEVKAGHIIFEMDGLSDKVASEALRLASHKLPLRTKIVRR
jgi:large subunit ribosomal protein L16